MNKKIFDAVIIGKFPLWRGFRWTFFPFINWVRRFNNMYSGIFKSVLPDSTFLIRINNNKFLIKVAFMNDI